MNLIGPVVGKNQIINPANCSSPKLFDKCPFAVNYRSFYNGYTVSSDVTEKTGGNCGKK